MTLPNDMSGRRNGYRGYVASRPILGSRVPQHIQNMVLRDYAQRAGIVYLLSATEYTFPHSYLMLEQVLAELPVIEGAIAYSLFMMPWRRERRLAAYQRVLDAGASLHFAVERLVLARSADIHDLEDIFVLQQTMLKPGMLGITDQLRSLI
ncbi:MAG TPA: LIC12192 family sporadic carbohydrate cluster protein [Dongiaceae bacterium]